jgi:5-methyltetrahydrofolate--homocysteine methyltransferase
MALQNGLSCAIINPNNEAMMQSYRSFCALTNQDENFMNFIGAFQNYKTPDKRVSDAVNACRSRVLDALGVSAANVSLSASAGKNGGIGTQNNGPTTSGTSSSGAATSSTPSSGDSGKSKHMELIERGMAKPAAAATKEALATKSSLDIINQDLVPALDIVGQGFEKGTLFLPQLILAADVAAQCFDVIKEQLSAAGNAGAPKGKIILATVKGDIHDIGKNIVKVILENYGYQVIDLGKDVDPQRVVDTAIAEDVRLVGLSALMTTTLVSMEETIALLHANNVDCRIMVGGAVLTEDYAMKIKADFYARDAKASADIARQVLG